MYYAGRADIPQAYLHTYAGGGGGHERSAVYILLQGGQCQQFKEGRKFKLGWQWP